MAISYVGGSTTSSGTTNGGVSTLSLTIPSNIAADDFAVVILSRANTSAITTAPSGFTQLANTSASTFGTTTVWYKKLLLSEANTSVTATWGTAGFSAMAIAVYRGVDKTNPFDQTFASSTKTTASTTLTFPAITTQSVGSYVLYAAGTVRSATGAGYTHTAPSGTNSRADATSSRTNSLNAGVEFADIEQVTAATVASTTGSASVTTYDVTFTMALRQEFVAAVPSIGSAEDLGIPSANVPQIATPTGIASQAAVPNPIAAYNNVLNVPTIGDSSGIGTPSSNTRTTAVAPSITTGEVVPAPVSGTRITATATGIATAAAVPTPVSSAVATGVATGIATAQAFGTPTSSLSEETWGVMQLI